METTASAQSDKSEDGSGTKQTIAHNDTTREVKHSATPNEIYLEDKLGLDVEMSVLLQKPSAADLELTSRPADITPDDVEHTRKSRQVADEHTCKNSDKDDPAVVREGKAEVWMSTSNNVFYNPVQEFNRDLSIAVLRLVARDKVDQSRHSSLAAGVKCPGGLTILEALSASGLRSIRYAREIPGVDRIVANDISPSAVASIAANAVRNAVDSIVEPSHADASAVMYRHSHADRFDAVDIDPYGCPSQFLDAAVQCVADGGLLLVTCTDMGVLSGNSPETCYSKYGAISIRVPACHEMALRIVLQCIESHANRHGRYIVPLLSLSADFYVRVFVKVFTADRPTPLDRLSMVYHCVGCHAVTLHPLTVYADDTRSGTRLPDGPPVDPECEHCRQRHTVGGPIWNAPIHDPVFVSRLQTAACDEAFGTSKRMQGVLAVIGEELEDVCLYHALDKLCSVIHTQVVPMMTFRSALINAGYRVSYSHANKNSVKTDAPARVVWDVLRCWVRDGHPVKQERLLGACRGILDQRPGTEVSFEWNAEANPASRLRGLVRFQANPQPFWGPGTRSKSNYQGEGQKEKKKRNQNRFKNKRIQADSNLPPNKYARTEDESSPVPEDVE